MTTRVSNVKSLLSRVGAALALCSGMQDGFAQVCPHLPATLPLDDVVTGNTCPPDPNPPRNDIVYESPAAATRFVLERPSSLAVELAGDHFFTPQAYLFSDQCPGGRCAPGATLPAGSYCLTVTASPFDAIGSCGCFQIATHVGIFTDGFETPP